LTDVIKLKNELPISVKKKLKPKIMLRDNFSLIQIPISLKYCFPFDYLQSPFDLYQRGKEIQSDVFKNCQDILDKKQLTSQDLQRIKQSQIL